MLPLLATLVELEAVLMAIVVALVVVGTTVFSRKSDDSSDTNEAEPVDEATEELDSAEQTPVVEDAVDDDIIVELISGSPISWKEFIELNPLSSSAELTIIISLIRSMFALWRLLII